MYLTGYFGNSTNPNLVIGTETLHNYSPGTTDIFLAKYDSTCSFLWARQAGGNGNDYATAINVAKSGNVYIAGSFESTTASFGTNELVNSATTNLFFATYDISGNAIYTKSADGFNNSKCNSIITTPGNTVYVSCGYTSDSIDFGTYLLLNADTLSNNFFLAKYSGTGSAKIPAITAATTITAYPNPVSTP